MNKIFVGFLSVIVGLGLGYLVFHSSTAPKGSMPGAQVQNDTFNFTGGLNAGTSNQFGISSTGALSSTAGITTTGAISAATFNSATIGSSSSTPAALGTSVGGFFTATTTTQLASTTAVTANSQIFIEPSPSSTAFTTLNVTCNTTAPSSTQITKIIPGNGFQVQTFPAPSGGTTPYCLSFEIVN